MIVQTALDREPHFVMTMNEHTEFCSQMVRAYGNDMFERPDPFDEIAYVVSNHDRGWDFYDADPGLDPDTRLPYTMVRTPTPFAVKTNSGSPDFNTQYSAYCGLLSSMHSWGLYNKRYGFSRFVVPTRAGTSITVKPEYEQMKKEMLEGELERQARLKDELKTNPKTAAWIEDKHLFQNYKQLQFFDTMALYFNTRHAGERGEEVYVHVPMTAEADATVTVRRIDDRTYTLDPFPFAGDRLVLSCRGKYMKPLPEDVALTSLGATLREIPADRQDYVLLPV